MKNKFTSSLIGIFCCALIGISLFLSFTPSVNAASRAVTGYAWSDNIGWIQMNPSPGGVFLDDTNGNLSGYAWSDNIGWVNFNPTGPYPTSPNSGVKMNMSTGQISGWARACAGMNDISSPPINQTQANNTCTGWTRTDGWDGWIRLRGNFHGVWIEDVAAPDPDEFRNWAWGSDDASGVALEGDEVIGWISFNRLNCDANRDGFSDGTPPGCPSIGTSVSDYKVMTTFAPTINTAPTVTNLTESAPNYCVTGSQRFLSFTIQDDPGDQVSYTTEDGFGNKIDACSGSVNIPSGQS